MIGDIDFDIDLDYGLIDSVKFVFDLIDQEM